MFITKKHRSSFRIMPLYEHEKVLYFPFPFFNVSWPHPNVIKHNAYFNKTQIKFAVGGLTLTKTLKLI